MTMYGNGVKIIGIIAMKTHLMMAVLGLEVMIIDFCGVAVGEVFQAIVVLPFGLCRQVIGTTILVFVLSVSRTFRPFTFTLSDLTTWLESF
jgi:hypothetical protein